MRLPLAALVCCVLAACATPNPAFRGVEPVTLTLDGRDYRVFVRRDAHPPQVQVIRLGYARRGDHDAILTAMPRAAMMASGCDLREGSIAGDTGVMTARLACR